MYIFAGSEKVIFSRAGCFSHEKWMNSLKIFCVGYFKCISSAAEVLVQPSQMHTQILESFKWKHKFLES